ncbi:hypothetical protein PF005_g15862 [Phytophthora fragariae]|uniref:Uncharacterized protein n=1 Tax=Phytophthora fragariae TaxID=53985 RepID=A0A6A3TB92_9STRA|nr:hypothetical protein PF003_g7900 [Phytophthora fragariae]KAE8932278.1 hypothetical protein PF009_g17683 [Phytophthora fragariae]KAE9097517.1 hypothetical protein PF007_g16585 [Phytophthora fragariae]KAE9097678.1 hypothetical protein PF010_g15861 [Phytophthora fragariae]KAE9133094.1 hypothetical protein PF006_g15123 [Phytophthora fragariae]
MKQTYRKPAAEGGRSSLLTAQRKLLAVWFVMGVLPLTLQVRSYSLFAKPHKLPEFFVVPHDQQKETANLTQVCPAQAIIMAGVWWNILPTHYYTVDQGTICHVVMPQYNTHGNYFVGSSKATPYYTTPSGCANDNFPVQVYTYHASVGFYSLYLEQIGTYCTEDKVAYVTLEMLGAYDINGSLLANDTGSKESRMSYWYGLAGASWLVYRSLIIRRSFVSCRSYGRRCDELGENLQQQEVIVFVQESLRLSAHGASNYQRTALLYLIVEGIMTDLLLIIAKDGWATKVQYASLGYNLSGLMLLLFEMLENMRWLSEKWRLRVKRLMFSYETALVGELANALALQHFLIALNKSDLKRSEPTALAVSYYVWGLFCHEIVIVAIFATISSVRMLCAVLYVWIKHRSFAVLSKPCCVDTALGLRSRIVLLWGYRWQAGELYYKPGALKAFGVLKMNEDGVEYLVLHKLFWFTAPRDSLVGIGVISGQCVEPCNDRPCRVSSASLIGDWGVAQSKLVHETRTELWIGQVQTIKLSHPLHKLPSLSSKSMRVRGQRKHDDF